MRSLITTTLPLMEIIPTQEQTQPITEALHSQVTLPIQADLYLAMEAFYIV